MTPFDRFDRLASQAVDRVNAEAFTHLPMVRVPNGRALIDRNRLRSDGQGVFSKTLASQGLQLGDRRSDTKANDLRTIVQGSRVELSVDHASHPDFAPHTADHIFVRGRRFSVSSVRPDGRARVVLILQEIET